jgi:hypothetical protein
MTRIAIELGETRVESRPPVLPPATGTLLPVTSDSSDLDVLSTAIVQVVMAPVVGDEAVLTSALDGFCGVDHIVLISL